MESHIEIVIADGQPIFRVGLRKILGDVKRFKIVGEAADGEAALELISEVSPDVIILCVDLPKKDGIEVARTILAQSLPVGVIFLTKHATKSCFNTALNLGVKGYLLKDSPATYLIDAVNTVSAGKNFISPVLSTLLLKRSRRNKLFGQTTPGINELTPSEKRVLILVSQYMTSREIAGELFISPRTVEHHRERIAEKLGLHGRNCLLKFSTEHQNELA